MIRQKTFPSVHIAHMSLKHKHTIQLVLLNVSLLFISVFMVFLHLEDLA